MIGDKHPKGFTLFETVVVLAVFSLVVVMVVTIFENASRAQRQEALSQAALSDARLTITSLTQAIKNMHIDYDFYKGQDFYEGSPAGCNTFPVPEEGGIDPCNLEDPVYVLALRDSTGKKVRYWYDDENQQLLLCVHEPLVSPRNCAFAEDPALSNYVNITPSNLHFVSFNFYITPLSDPAFRGTLDVCGNNAACTCVRSDTAPIEGEYCTGTGADIPESCKQGCPGFTSGYCDATGTGFCVIPDAQPTVTISAIVEGEGLQVGTVRLPFQITATSRIYDR